MVKLSKEDMIFRTYNLTVAGLCTIDRSDDFINYFKNEIFNSFNGYTDFYNIDTIGSAEFKPELLKKTSKMAFRKPKDYFDYYVKTFFGYSSDKSIEERYKLLFGSLPDGDFGYAFHPVPPFNKERLLNIMQSKFGVSNTCSGTAATDITVHFKYNPLPNSKAYIEIKCSVSPKFKLPFNTVDSFIDMVERAASHFTDEFCSAYISYAPENLSVTHTSLCFRFDGSMVSEYILGGEWFVYMNKSIQDKLSPDILESISRHAFVKEQKRGISYKAHCDITEFDNYRNSYHTLLQGLIIPAYGEIGWYHICDGDISYGIRPSTVYVFNTGYDPQTAPRIVLAHNCSVEDVCRYDVLTKDDLMFSMEI